MNQEKIAKIIKDTRLNNNLSQKEYADKFGVTFQAVSKWETGKSIPDIAILKEICKEYNLSLDDLVDNKKVKNNTKKYIIVIIAILIVILLFILLFKHKDFEFKTISSSCNDFNVTGSIAYNKDKSSIYISNINYCGNESLDIYDNIKCNFYEDNGKTKTIIDSCQELEKINLNEYLKQITFNIDNYNQTCNEYTENSLFLEIEANKDGKISQYKIPLKLSDNCK